MIKRSVVTLVDDDESVREALPDLLKEFGYAVRVYASAEAFLASGALAQTDCLIVDVAMPGMTGPELQRDLKRRGSRVPIVFITAQRDETVRARLIADGAVECVFKPFSDTDLQAALDRAFR